MTFEVKQSITFVATYPLVILTKFGRNPIKHVEEEANCEKERRRRRRMKNLTFEPLYDPLMTYFTIAHAYNMFEILTRIIFKKILFKYKYFETLPNFLCFRCVAAGLL